MSEHTAFKKFSAWAIFLTFVGISAVANYLHGRDALAGFLMAMAPIGFAATMGLLEVVVVRVSWPSRLAMATVALGSGVASYVSLLGLATEHHVPWLVAVLLPLAFDGVVLASSLAIRTLSKPGHVDMSLDIELSKTRQELARMTELAKELDRELSNPVQSVVQMSREMDMAIPPLDMAVSKGLSKDMEELARDWNVDSLDTELSNLLDSQPVPVGTVDTERMSWDTDGQALSYARTGKAHGLTAGDIAELIGGWYGVSSKTVRRSSWWKQAMQGIAPTP